MTSRGGRRLPRRLGALAVAALAFVPGLVTRLRRRPPPPRVALVLLTVLAVALTVATRTLGLSPVPAAMLVVPVLGAGLLLERRQTRLVLVVVALCFAYDVSVHGIGLGGVRLGTGIVLLITAGVAYEFARAREETGLSGASGEGVLVELRQRLEMQGRLPELPAPWRAEARLCPAGGGPFAGDFVASALTGGGRCLEVVLVDVSGKGVAAGTRALLLSGALGGLLGAVPPPDFLPAANAYLDRQDWAEGFATAVHVVLSLDDGRYTVASAGHPPPAVFDAGSGRWALVQAEGPALGLLPDVHYDTSSGQLERGDALMLYTDGLVEVPGRDLGVGIDKLLGEAERVVTRGFAGGADWLVQRVSADSNDDRGLVLLWHAG
ncbi:MAG TPA: PP2C family protein-serine/threonine phosphatase [Mycobacteriales bacterium]|nr:PP2C family protein-serine/threonine phosphatase [Mycobacteriales bacterium]